MMQRSLLPQTCKRRRVRWLVYGALPVAIGLGSAIALAAETVAVTQKDRAFSVRELTLPRGGMVNFTNEDDFPHQVHASGPNMDIDSSLQDQGEVVSIPFPNAGQFEVRCGIHPHMRLTVHVE